MDLTLDRQTIDYANDAEWHALRGRDITSTEVAALFDASPYMSRYELWHRKKGTPGADQGFEQNERMRWGTKLEAAIAETIAEQMTWTVAPFKQYMSIPSLRIGASFDYLISAPDRALFEIKNVDWLAFRNGWRVEDGFVEAPTHIELQAQHQMLVSGLRRLYFGVLVGGNQPRVIEREADPAVHRAIIREVAAFWKSIDENREPSPLMPDDAEAVIRMHQVIEPGKLYDARDDAAVQALLARHKAASTAESRAKDEKEVAKAELFTLIGSAEKVIASGFTASAGVVAPSLGTLVTPEMVGSYVGGRSGYRMLRVTEKK